MFVIDVPYINLNHIYNSKQCPRWIKLRDDKYIVIFKNKALKIEQQRDRYDWAKHRLIMNCTENEFYDIWFDYFDLKTDYFLENRKIKSLGGKFKIPANKANGIHILRQDNFETYVYCKLVSYVGFAKASELMNRIAQTYGICHKQSMREVGKVTWYEWPTPYDIANALNNEHSIGTGKVKPFLRKLCNAIIYDGYQLTNSDNKLFRLFGMHDISIFPSEGVKNVVERNFNCEFDDFTDLYFDDTINKGLTYAYILYHIVNREVLR